MSFASHSREVPLRTHCALPGPERLQMLAAYALHFRLLYLGRDGSDNAPGYLVLYGEKVGQVSVVALSPYMRATFRFDQLGGDTHALARTANATLQDIPYAEFAANSTYVGRLTLIGKARVASDDEHPPVFRQARDNVLGDTVREIFLSCITRHVVESEDGDRRLVRQ